MDNNELEIWKKLNECECVNRVFGAKDWVLNMIPLFDPIRPERSLWMIAYNLGLYNLEVIASDFLRPDLALARAIIEQEKGEGDGLEIR